MTTVPRGRFVEGKLLKDVGRYNSNSCDFNMYGLVRRGKKSLFGVVDIVSSVQQNQDHLILLD